MTKRRMLTLFAATALAGAVSLTALTGCSGGSSSTDSLNPTAETAGVLLLSVNPEIQLAYDQNGDTLTLTGVNDDGAQVLTDYDGYQGKPADDVVEELIGRIYAGGYFEETIDGHPKNLVLKLENGSRYPSDDFLETIAAQARSSLDAQQVSSQTVTVDQDDYDQNHLQEGYINAQTAQSILSAQLGRNDLQFVEKDYDIDDGTYEIEFVLDGIEYEYEVNASNGKVLEVDAQRHNANDDWGDDVSDDWDDRFDDQDDDWDDQNDDWDDGIGENRSDDWDDDQDDDDDWDDDDHRPASVTPPSTQTAQPTQPAAPTPSYDDDWDDDNDDWDDDIGENRSDDWDDDHDDDDDWDDDDDDDDDHDDDWDDDDDD